MFSIDRMAVVPAALGCALKERYAKGAVIDERIALAGFAHGRASCGDFKGRGLGRPIVLADTFGEVAFEAALGDGIHGVSRAEFVESEARCVVAERGRAGHEFVGEYNAGIDGIAEAAAQGARIGRHSGYAFGGQAAAASTASCASALAGGSAAASASSAAGGSATASRTARTSCVVAEGACGFRAGATKNKRRSERE